MGRVTSRTEIHRMTTENFAWLSEMAVPGSGKVIRELRESGMLLQDVSVLTSVELESKGMSPGRAKSLYAVMQLARLMCQPAPVERILAGEPEQAAAVFVPRLAHLQQEELHVMGLNTKGQILYVTMVNRGGLASSIVEPRVVFREAFFRHAASIVVAHNHPSGEPEPSRDDQLVTRDWMAAGELLGIRVLDHIIVGFGGRWHSMRKAGHL